MRRDPLFYKLFQQSPDLLFQLIDQRPENAADYRFDSVAVKEPKFEIDGVFLPPESAEPGVVYFCEVQIQKDEELYERLISESALYFYRNRSRFSDWQAVVIYPSRNVEQSNTQPFRALLNCDQFHRIFLDELGEPDSLTLPVAALVLTIVESEEAPEVARSILSRAEQAPLTPKERSEIIDVVTSILVYKFSTLSRTEIRAMLGINLSEEPRAIREAKEEGREEGRQEGREEGRQEGREEEAIAFIARMFTRRFKQELPEETRSRLTALPLPILRDLGDALLDFNTIEDLENWITEHRSSGD